MGQAAPLFWGQVRSQGAGTGHQHLPLGLVLCSPTPSKNKKKKSHSEVGTVLGDAQMTSFPFF